jgi:hypothetical protein
MGALPLVKVGPMRRIGSDGSLTFGFLANMATILGLVGPAGLVFIPIVTRRDK